MVDNIFDQPGASFVLLPEGIKFPPLEKEWQKKGHSFQEAQGHKGNIGIMAGAGYIGLDQDDPAAFTGLELPISTKWETRPGRYGLWFKVSDSVAAALAGIGKKPDQAQLKLHKDGLPVGEVKLERTYQVIPPSWKILEDGSRADYKLLDSSPPAEISLSKLLADLQAIGISFSSKLEKNAAKLEQNGREARKKRAETDEAKARRYAEAALRDEILTLAGAPEGDRNDQLFKSTACLAEFVAARLLDENRVISELTRAAENTGLDSEEIARTIRSGSEAGRQHPRKIPKREEPTRGDPSIRPVSADDRKGEVGIGPKGTICQVSELEDKETGEKKKFLAWVSDCALYIETETRAKDETEFIFAGIGAADKRAVRFTLPASALAESKKFKAALINAFGAKNRIGNLNFEMVQRISLNPRLLLRVEAPAWDGNIPLLPGLNLAGNVEFKLSPKIPASLHEGDLQAAGDVLKKLLRVHRFAPLVVAAIMGAPAVARWHKGDRFGLGLWGQTGTLKTSIVLAAMGIYGTGYLDAPRLKAGKGGATLVAAMEIFASAGFLPQLYDNVKTVDSKDSQNYIAALHAVLEGEEKARGKKDGGLRESREFLCTPIVTGEVRPQEASTSARVLNLNWSQPDANLLGEVQKNAALLPVVGYHWLRFLAETNYILGKDFEAFRSKKMEEFLGLRYVNPGRLATIYALMVGTWQLLEESPMGDIFQEAHESFKTALDEATAAQGQAVSEETEIERFLNGLEELIASNPGLIQSKDGKKTIAGSIIGKEMELGLFLLPTETLNELMKIKAFNQQPTIDSITQALNERQLLVPGTGKLQNRQRINGTRVYGWYIRVSPQKEGTKGDTKGDAKNDNSGQFVPPVPRVLPENKRKYFGDENSKDTTQKDFLINTGDTGDKGDSIERDKEIDIDFDDKKIEKSVPFSVPPERNKGDTLSSEYGMGPHPRASPPPGGRRHFCSSCGKHFDTPLVVHGPCGSFICESCRRSGPPTATTAAEAIRGDHQSQLGGEAAP